MKVLDLFCEQSHRFEGWFASEADFQSQLSGGMLQCPVCGESKVRKLPSAARLNLSVADGRVEGDAHAPQAVKGSEGWPALTTEVQGLLMRAVREIVAHTEDVGADFAKRALSMHQGEEEARPIRGQATVGQAVELREAGVDVWPLPLFPGADETLQ